MMIGIKGEHLRRVGWLLLALLFIVTGLGVGVYAFWVNTHPAKDNQSQTQKNTLAGKPLTNFTPVNKIDSLQVVDTKAGTGTEVKPDSTVIVDYTGAVAATGIVFQSSLDNGQPVGLKLDQVIKGWAQGLPGMKEGGSRRLLIPASLAYGATPPSGSGIPANADLVFDITLIKVQ